MTAATAVKHFDANPNSGSDVRRLSVHETTVGMGIIVVGVAWLAFYIIALAHSLFADPAPPTSTAKPTAVIFVPVPR
jgi:hypothetical protein